MNILLKIDGEILLFIQDCIRNSILTPVFKFITLLGDKGIIWIALSLILCLFKQTREAGIICLSALLLSQIIDNMIIKNIVQRTRPFYVVDKLIPVITRPTSYSFPSGHTASSFAAASVMFRKLPKKYGILAIILAVLIGFSRLYLGVHFPSDVIFGVITGILFGYLAEYIVNIFQKYLLKER